MWFDAHLIMLAIDTLKATLEKFESNQISLIDKKYIMWFELKVVT